MPVTAARYYFPAGSVLALRPSCHGSSCDLSGLCFIDAKLSEHLEVKLEANGFEGAVFAYPEDNIGITVDGDECDAFVLILANLHSERVPFSSLLDGIVQTLPDTAKNSADLPLVKSAIRSKLDAFLVATSRIFPNKVERTCLGQELLGNMLICELEGACRREIESV